MFKRVWFGILVFIFLLAFAGIAAGQDRLSAYLDQADQMAKQGNPLVAGKMYQKAIQAQPGNLSIYYKRAFMWGKSGYYGQAIKDFTFVINSSGRRFEHAPRFRADCYVAIGQYQEASEDYIIFLKSAPRDGKVWSYLAETYALMGRTDLALQAAEKGLATGSHWEKRLQTLKRQIMYGEKIKPHKPLTN